METLPYNLLIMADMDGWLIIAVVIPNLSSLFTSTRETVKLPTIVLDSLGSWNGHVIQSWPIRCTQKSTKLWTEKVLCGQWEWHSQRWLSPLPSSCREYGRHTWDWGCHLMTSVKCSQQMPSQGSMMVNPPNWNK